MAGVEGPDERTVVPEPALEGVAGLAVLSGCALLVERLEEVADEGEWERHAIQVHGGNEDSLDARERRGETGAR